MSVEEEQNLPSFQLEELKELQPHIKLCRDFYTSYTKVMTKDYLPEWKSETPEAYDLRKKATPFFNYYLRYVISFTSLVFQKAPIIENLDDFHIDDVDNAGTSFYSFMRDAFTSSVVGGVEFIAVVSTQDNKRAYFKRYKYEQLQSFRTEDGDKLTQIVFKEEVTVNSGAFGVKTGTQYTVFYKGGGEIWGEDENKKVVFKRKWENSLDEVPVTPLITGRGDSFLVAVPILHDIANVNLALLQKHTQLAKSSIAGVRPLLAIYGYGNQDKVKMKAGGKETVGTHGVGAGDVFYFATRDGCDAHYIEPKNNYTDGAIKEIELIDAQMSTICFDLLRTLDSKTIVEAHDNQNKGASFLRASVDRSNGASVKLFTWKAQIENRPLPKDFKVEFRNSYEDFTVTKHNLPLLMQSATYGYVSDTEIRKTLIQHGVLGENVAMTDKDFKEYREKFLTAKQDCPENEENSKEFRTEQTKEDENNEKTRKRRANKKKV